MKKTFLQIVFFVVFVSGCGQDNGTSPFLASAMPAMDSFTIGSYNSRARIMGTARFEDPDRDVVLLRVSKRDCGEGNWIHLDTVLNNVGGMAFAEIRFFTEVSTNCDEGTYFLELSLFDSQGQQSNRLILSYWICPFLPCK